MSVSLFEPNASGNTTQQRIQFPDNLSTAPPTSSTSSNQKDNAISEAATTAPSVEFQSDCNSQDFDSANNEDVELSVVNDNEEMAGSENNSAKEGDNRGTSEENTDINEVQNKRRSSRSTKVQPQTEQMAPLADPWKPITPHEAANTIPKPIRRGRTRRAPTANVKLSGTKSRPKKNAMESQPIVPVEDFMIQQLSGGKYSLNGLRVGNKDTCMAAELQDRAEAVEKQRKRKAALENKQNNNVLEVLDDENIAELQDNQDVIDDDNDNWDEVEFENDALPDPHEGGITALVPADLIQQEHLLGNNSVTNDAEGSNEVDSYEELVMKRVAAYVAQSQNYIESTDLAKRVAKWHESIGPRLDAVEKRGHFDIHQYGSKILEYFPDGMAKTTIKFNDVARGKEREEVSRYFLSSLMLANTYNVELSNTTSEPLVMDQVELTLLSTKRHHENMFQDTSAGEPSNNTTSPKRKGRQRKSQVSSTIYASDEDDILSNSMNSNTGGRKNVKKGKPKNSLKNGLLRPIAEEQILSFDDSPVIKHRLNASPDSLQTCSVNLERLDDSQLSSAEASPERSSTVPKISEHLRNGHTDSSSNATFKVPVSSVEGYKPGRKRKMR